MGNTTPTERKEHHACAAARIAYACATWIVGGLEVTVLCDVFEQEVRFKEVTTGSSACGDIPLWFILVVCCCGAYWLFGGLRLLVKRSGRLLPWFIVFSVSGVCVWMGVCIFLPVICRWR